MSILHDDLDDQPEGVFDINADVYSVGYEVVNVEVELCTPEGCDVYEMDESFNDNYSANIDLGANPTILEYAIYASDSNDEQARYPQDGYIMFTYGDLEEIYLYDFEGSGQDWQAGWSGDNASSGDWEWGNPNPTYWEGVLVQTGDDHTEDGTSCFVTGNVNDPNNVGADDVDGGETTLFSPVLDLSGSDDVLLTYWRWYTNNAGDNPSSDYWNVDVSNNGGDSWISLESTTLSNASWTRQRFVLSDFIELTDQMQLRFIAEDVYNDGDNGTGGSLVEAAVDDIIFQDIPFAENCEPSGDLNGDQQIDILDMVLIINIILYEPNPSEEILCNADINQDNLVNILDIVELINWILD